MIQRFRLTPWFALFGVVAAAANLLLGNHISFVFWVVSMAVPGLAIDLSRMVNGSRAWERKEGWVTWRTAGAVAIVVVIAAPLESLMDHLGGYDSSKPLMNTDWSQLSDVVAITAALLAARQFLQLTRPRKPSTAHNGQDRLDAARVPDDAQAQTREP